MSLTYHLNSPFKTYWSYYSYSGNGTHISLLIVKGYIRSLSQISAAEVQIVLSIDIPAQMELSFVSNKCKFWVQDTIMHCLQKPVTELLSSHNCHLWLLEPVLILYSSRRNISFGLHAVVVKTCVFWANCARNLWGECFDLASISSFVNTAFCLPYFLSKKDPVETLYSVRKSLMKPEPEHQDIYGQTCVYFTI
jgi:hypothetical protein